MKKIITSPISINGLSLLDAPSLYPSNPHVAEKATKQCDFWDIDVLDIVFRDLTSLSALTT